MGDQEFRSSVAGSGSSLRCAPEGLIAKLEGATGPNRELDAHLWCLTQGHEFVLIATGDEAYGDICDPGDRGYGDPNTTTPGYLYFRKCPHDRARENAVQGFGSFPAYTTSVDAILALIERELPGWTWVLSSADPAATLADGSCRFPAQFARAKTPALALCIAFLRARSADQPRAPLTERDSSREAKKPLSTKEPGQ